MIPRIIHQIWVGPKKKPEKLMNTWKDMNPEWEHIIWDSEKISEKYPNGFKNQKHIDEIEEWAGKADIMRYEILHDYGGFYIDADSICINSLDDHFLKHDCFACFENEECRGQLVANGYLGAIKDCKLMKILIEKISNTESVSHEKTGKMAWQSVGPLFFTETIIENQYPISVYPSFVFIPEHYSGYVYQGKGKSYSRQLWGSTREFGGDPEFYNNI
jgi:mannosyltransferase OCH1-like enzyme